MHHCIQIGFGKTKYTLHKPSFYDRPLFNGTNNLFAKQFVIYCNLITKYSNTIAYF